MPRKPDRLPWCSKTCKENGAEEESKPICRLKKTKFILFMEVYYTRCLQLMKLQ